MASLRGIDRQALGKRPVQKGGLAAFFCVRSTCRALVAFDTYSMTNLSRDIQSKMGVRHGIKRVQDMLGKLPGSTGAHVHMQRELLRGGC